MKDLKNKLTEEEAKQLLRNCYLWEKIDCSLVIDDWKQSGIIRKSALEEAREKTDELMITLRDNALESEEFRDLKQLIQAERKIVDEEVIK
jgi:hypothetical protein